MRATGFIRYIDDLGRVVIPREIRKSVDIREGDALEIFVDTDEKAICFKRYLPYIEPWHLLEDVAETMRNNDDFREFAADVEVLARKIKKSAQS